MKLIFNPYTLVIKEADDTLNFMLSDKYAPLKLKPNDEQNELLKRLFNGEELEYNELLEKFDKFFVDSLLKLGALGTQKPDTKSITSRTDAFFMTYNMPEARAKLKSKKVLVLGCGGIGTHMAWHMTALGVKKLTLVDFDTIEESNFNRQLMFDLDDVGKVKAEVLKQKLGNINKDVEIETVCTRISSKEELEKICLRDNYDLIIKALDSPAEFPVWLDEVAVKNGLTYISGITMRNNVLIGPTHLNSKSKYSWSELMNVDYSTNSAQRIYGTAPSLGAMLYHISDELAIEAVKILTGYGKLKYVDRILCEDIIAGESHYFSKDEPEEVKENPKDSKAMAVNILLMAVLSLFCLFERMAIPAAIIAALVMPFVLFEDRFDISRCNFINTLIVSIGIMVSLYSLIPTSSLILLVIVQIFIHSTLILLMCSISFAISSVKSRVKGKLKSKKAKA